VTEDEFLLNILNVLRYDAYHNLLKLRQPVNKDKWSTEPAVVNAFYNPNKNDIGEQGFGGRSQHVARTVHLSARSPLTQTDPTTCFVP
jgi:hypothetical protein